MRSLKNKKIGILGISIIAASLLGAQANAEVYYSEQVTEAAVPQSAIELQSEATVPEINAQGPSRLEVLRKERVRQEVKNEEEIQAKLEELRLQDEQKRLQQVMGGKAAPAAAQKGQFKDGLMLTSASAGSSQDTAQADGSMERQRNVMITVQPRATIAKFGGGDLYKTSARVGGGIGVGALLGDMFGAEVGYSYSEHGVTYTGALPPAAQQAQAFSQTGDFLTMKQNVLDLNARIYFFDRDYRFRPFASAGGAYSKSYVNYESRYKDELSRLIAQGGFGATAAPNLSDHNISQWLGSLGVGFDFQITRQIALVPQFRYYSVLSNKISGGNTTATPLNDPLNGDLQKQQTANSLSRSGFFTVSAGLNVSF